MSNFEKVKEVIVSELGVNPEEVSMDSRIIEDLGADSLALIEMIMNFESEYDVTLPDEALSELKTVGDVVRALDQIQ